MEEVVISKKWQQLVTGIIMNINTCVRINPS